MNCFDTDCIYYTPSTAVDLVGKPKPCARCARNYRDYYKSTSIPIANTPAYTIPDKTVVLKKQ